MGYFSDFFNNDSSMLKQNKEDSENICHLGQLHRVLERGVPTHQSWMLITISRSFTVYKRTLEAHFSEQVISGTQIIVCPLFPQSQRILERLCHGVSSLQHFHNHNIILSNSRHLQVIDFKNRRECDDYNDWLMRQLRFIFQSYFLEAMS